MVKGWCYRPKEREEPEFVKIWLEFFPDHKSKAFSKNSYYSVNEDGKVETVSDGNKALINCKEVELSEVRYYLSGIKNYELW